MPNSVIVIDPTLAGGGVGLTPTQNQTTTTNCCDDKLDELIRYLSISVPAKLEELTLRIDAVAAHWQEASRIGKEVHNALINSLSSNPSRFLIGGVEYDNFAKLNERLQEVVSDTLDRVEETRQFILDEVNKATVFDNIEIVE